MPVKSHKYTKPTVSRSPILVSREIQTDPVVFLDTSQNSKTAFSATNTSQLSGDSGIESETSGLSRSFGVRRKADDNNTFHGDVFPRSPARKRQSFGNSSMVQPKTNNEFSPRSSAIIPLKRTNVKKDLVQPLKVTPLRMDVTDNNEDRLWHMPMRPHHPHSNMHLPGFAPYPPMAPPHGFMAPFTSPPFGYYLPSPNQRSTPFFTSASTPRSAQGRYVHS